MRVFAAFPGVLAKYIVIMSKKAILISIQSREKEGGEMLVKLYGSDWLLETRKFMAYFLATTPDIKSNDRSDV